MLAVDRGRRDVEIAPFDFVANLGLAGVLDAGGDSRRAVEIMQRANRMSPRHPASFDYAFASYLLNAGDPGAALEKVDKAIARTPKRPSPRFIRIAILGALEREADARQAAAELLALKPDASVSKWLGGRRRTKNPDQHAWVGDLLLKAGVPK